MSGATYTYGKGAVAVRRRWLHERIVAMREADELSTNVRALYYDGVQAGRWESDGDCERRKHAEARAAGKRVTRVRVSSQDTSDDVQWLIDRGHVGADEVVDESTPTYDHLGTVDVLSYLIDHAANVAVDPWAPHPTPYLLTEGANDLSVIGPIGREYRCRWAALGGMASRGMLRRVAKEIDPAAPVGYVGDWNRSGSDIERNARDFLADHGWHGTWTRVAVTDRQIARLALVPKVKFDHRHDPPLEHESFESAAIEITRLRRRLRAWLRMQLPTDPTATDDERADIVAALEELFERRTA